MRDMALPLASGGRRQAVKRSRHLPRHHQVEPGSGIDLIPDFRTS
jgi:hypothetical protein